MKRIFAFLILVVALGLVGCQGSDAPIADAQKRNADGEVEGKEPTFVMVPAQNDPNNPNKK